MYSLNQDKAVLAILERLELLDTKAPLRPLPFRPRTRAPMEAVRPVYWQNRPKSYVQRTSSWSTFPETSWREAQCASPLLNVALPSH
jgi:methylenetetrahydrofolate reductase (NADPH)